MEDAETERQTDRHRHTMEPETFSTLKFKR